MQIMADMPDLSAALLTQTAAAPAIPELVGGLALLLALAALLIAAAFAGKRTNTARAYLQEEARLNEQAAQLHAAEAGRLRQELRIVQKDNHDLYIEVQQLYAARSVLLHQIRQSQSVSRN